MNGIGRLREDAQAVFEKAVAAVDPRHALMEQVSIEGNALRIGGERYPLPTDGRILVIGAGKAAAAMASAMEELLGERISEGVVVTKYGHSRPLQKIRIVEAAHPVPDEHGVEGTRQILRLLEESTEADLVLCLISGGGSALLVAPAPGLLLQDKQDTTRLLLESGASIQEVNTVRKHLSAVKGGGLARAASPATLVTLILSDVVGDPLEVVASGPTVPDPTTFGDALHVIDRHHLRERLPQRIRTHLEEGLRGQRPETPKPGEPLFRRSANRLLGNNARAVEAAAAEARKRGYTPLVLSTTVTGEARHIAALYAAIAREVIASGRPAPAPLCLLSGGETTVTLQGDGKGGRAQEFALSAGIEIAGLGNVLILAAGTDGTDGPTDAAGAMADGQTLERAREAGLDAVDHLQSHDAYPFFDRLGDLLRTGPTGTNVMDLYLAMIGVNP